MTTAYFLARRPRGHPGRGKGRRSASRPRRAMPGSSRPATPSRGPRRARRGCSGSRCAARTRPFAWARQRSRLYRGAPLLRECTERRSRRNTLVKLGLCQYSQGLIDALVRAEGIEYPAIAQGALYLHRDPRELGGGGRADGAPRRARPEAEILDAGGWPESSRSSRRCGGRLRARSTISATRAATPGASSSGSPAGGAAEVRGHGRSSACASRARRGGRLVTGALTPDGR